MLLLLLSFIAVMLWMVVFRYRRRQMYKLAAKIKGCDQDLPVIGIAHTLTGNTEDIMSQLKTFCYASIKQDGIMTAWLNHILYFVMTDPVDLEVVLKTSMEKDDLHRFIRKIIGNGGIFAPVSIWKKRRKVMVPMFSPKIVESFVDVFAEQSETLIDKMAKTCGKEKYSVWPFISTFTLDAVCQTAMGVKVNAQSNPNTPFLVAISRLLNLVCERIFHLWLQPDWLYKLFVTKYNQHQKHLRTMHDFTDEVIRLKREELKIEKQSREKGTEFDLGNYRQKSFLDLLISMSGGEKGYTNEELREEVLTLTIAGTDTSAVAISNTLKMFAKYPEVQQRVYDEIYEVFGDSNRTLVKGDLLQLKYLERVVKETLRLFPPVPFIIRKILEETKLPSGRVIPAGAGVVAGIWGIHRDPKYWGPNAEKFDPDRFLPERFDLKHACSYMPFSQGPRNCLGYQYALMSVKTCLTSIVRKFKVVPEPENSDIPQMRVKIDVMMKDVDGYEIALESRDSHKQNNNDVPYRDKPN